MSPGIPPRPQLDGTRERPRNRWQEGAPLLGPSWSPARPHGAERRRPARDGAAVTDMDLETPVLFVRQRSGS